MVEGWILDLHPGRPGEMVVWIKTDGGKCVRLVDKWCPSIYISSSSRQNLADLVRQLKTEKRIQDWAFDMKFRESTDAHRSQVLKLIVLDARRTEFLAEKIHRSGGYMKYRIYNVDIWPEQRYLYDKDLFPLARVKVEVHEDGLSWVLKDEIEDLEYDVPPLTNMRLSLQVQKRGKIPSLLDPIKTIMVKTDDECIEIDSGVEAEKILELVRVLRRLDPDIIYTSNGDSFVMPYLATRARSNHVSDELVLGREDVPLTPRWKGGTSYFSYGQIYYKPPSRILLGRVHIDEENTHIYADCRLDGLVEVSRLCRVPLQRASRATIGTCMMGAQLYHALKEDMLIPWKKTMVEQFKNGKELLVADRGGFIFEPRVGIHESVGEIDFKSMYPSLMASMNISGETVNCECCPDSPNHVPELGYHLCQRRIGITPRTLELLLEKRAAYKQLRDKATASSLKTVYDNRQAAIKWILVCAFGYLSYRNAKFGRIDAHIAVCAYARKFLLEATYIAESHGFEIIHGIVDSLWLRKPGAGPSEYLALCREIEEKLGLAVSFEGIYNWIIFLPSKVRKDVPVLNRYYGVFRDGRIKARGVEVRRHDTPEIVSRCQKEMLEALAKAQNSHEFIERIPESLEVLKRYMSLIRSGEAPIEELAITKRLSKNPSEYTNSVLTAVIARQLMKEGANVQAGQMVKYIITDYDNKDPDRRAIAAELADPDVNYDVEKYLELLIDSAATILAPFNFTTDSLWSRTEHIPEEQNLLPRALRGYRSIAH